MRQVLNRSATPLVTEEPYILGSVPAGAIIWAHCFEGFCDVGELDASEGPTFFMLSMASLTSRHLFSPPIRRY